MTYLLWFDSVYVFVVMEIPVEKEQTATSGFSIQTIKA